MPKPDTMSYALERKTDKLLKTHKSLNRAMAVLISVGAIAGLLWVYFIGNIDLYLSKWSVLYSGSVNALTLTEAMIFNALILATLSFAFVYVIWNKHNEKYDKLKKEILKILELEPCYHKDPCGCKDDYCQWLEQDKGVDLL